MALTARLLGTDLTFDASPQLGERLRRELAPLGLGNSAEPGNSLPAEVLSLQDPRPAAVDPVQTALTEITGAAIKASPLFCVHAGVVATRGRRPLAIAVPNASGHGKTTLVGALIAEGFGYVSDEVLAVDRTTHAITAFARPLALDARSWRILDLDAARCPAPGYEQLAQPGELSSDEWTPSATVPLKLGKVLLAARTVDDSMADADVRLVRLSAGRAVQALLANSFNHYLAPANSFHTAAQLAREAEVWQLNYRHAPTAARAIATRWLAI